MAEEERTVLNFIILGTAKVGKTAMVQKLLDSSFSEEYTPNTETRIFYNEYDSDFDISVLFLLLPFFSFWIPRAVLLLILINLPSFQTFIFVFSLMMSLICKHLKI